MRKKTHTVALAIGACAAVCSPFVSCSSNDSTTPSQDAGLESMVLSAGKCGDGILNLGEQCDPGPDGGPGCDKHCNLFCIPDTINGNALCDDHNPCNGVETCAAPHNDAGVPPNTCAKGTPLADGMPCGNGSTCRNQMCGGAAVCGNGVQEGSEECDLGSNNGKNMGCGTDCRFTCVPNDATRDCASTNPCVAQGSCDGTTHICAAGASAADGTSCGTGLICKSGSCIPMNCGDGVVEAPEQCDFGPASSTSPGNGIGTGCEANCTFSCTLSPNNCITPDTCGGTNTCTAITVGTSTGQKCVVGTPPAMGTSCMNGGMCDANQQCTGQPNCGNGTINGSEQCDWGTMNAHGAGCEPDCTFSCGTTALSPNACPGLDVCSAAPEVCQTTAGPTGNPGQKCNPGIVLSSCASCGGTSICANNTCKPNSCGDGCVVPPETCDPPGRACSATCQKIVCGNGVLEGQEQCDDGNTQNLDGCDQYCNFEQLQRATSLQYSSTTDSFCPLNLLGTQIITAAGLSVIQQNTDQDVAAGRTNVIFKFYGMSGATADPTGTSGPVILGSLAATAPQAADAGTYDGTNDLDWWYTVDPATVGPNNVPLSTLNGTYTSATLTAGPGLLGLRVNLSGSLADLQMWNTKIKVQVGAATTPTASTGGPPGHVASENIQPMLKTFATGGVGGTGPTGEMCGNMTAQSLSKVVTPPLLQVGMATSCVENYTTINSLLDVLVHGCTLMSGGATMGIMNPTQPDQRLASVTFTPVGGGTSTPPYFLSSSSANSTTHIIDTCKDSSTPTAKAVPLATCLQGLAYSSAFTFQTDRVIIRP